LKNNTKSSCFEDDNNSAYITVLIVMLSKMKNPAIFRHYDVKQLIGEWRIFIKFIINNYLNNKWIVMLFIFIQRNEY
jgi:hypothetical protein